jgi:hypothetical protein
VRPLLRPAVLAGVLLLAGVADAQPGGRGRGGPMGGDGFADPAAVIQAEIAVGHLALQKGQWDALSRTAAKGAVLLVPQPVVAESWLGKQPAVASPARLNTHFVYLSCDGATALTAGTWSRPDGAKGWYRAVWQRARKKNFYQWVVATAGRIDTPGEEPDAITAKVAHCARREGPPTALPLPPDPRQALPAEREEKSPDGSLRWRWSAGQLQGWMATESGETQILSDGPAS